MSTFNIYCDESCHLEHDMHKVMVLGAIVCPIERVRESAERLREIKQKYGLNRSFELKWNKVSVGQREYYLQTLDYFFDDDDLSFRAVVIPDKSVLKHEEFGQDHDTWYYKMMFRLLEPLLSPDSRYRIYLDIKDTRSEQKVRKLHDVLCSDNHDFDRRIIERVQMVRSNEVEHIQLADLLIGAICYANRGLSGNEAKVLLVERMKRRSRYSLTRSTLLQERKVNILVWRPRDRS